MSNTRRKSTANEICLSDNVNEQIIKRFFFIIGNHFNANEQCFKCLKDEFKLATTTEHMFLNTMQLVDDNEWTDLVNKLLIKQ